MNKPLKIAAIILVITSGVIGAYLIVENSASSVQSGKNPETAALLSAIPKNPIQWVRQVASNGNVEGQNVPPPQAETTTAQSSSDNNSINLTQFVAGSVFNQMKKSDESGSGPFKNFDPKDPESQKAIADAIAKLDDPASILNQVVSDLNFKISSDNSSQSKSAYLELTGETIIKNSNEFYSNPAKVVTDAINLGNVVNAKKLADTYETIYSAFLNIPVPSDWKDLHKKYLTLLKKSEGVYRGVADFQNDPIKAGLLTQIAPDLAKQELKIKQEYYKKVLEINS